MYNLNFASAEFAEDTRHQARSCSSLPHRKRHLRQAVDNAVDSMKSALPEEKRLYAHGQGYDLVERPAIRDDEPMKLKANMNITIHPITGSKTAFAWVCDNYLLTEKGASECLHKTPKKIFGNSSVFFDRINRIDRKKSFIPLIFQFRSLILRLISTFLSLKLRIRLTGFHVATKSLTGCTSPVKKHLARP